MKVDTPDKWTVGIRSPLDRFRISQQSVEHLGPGDVGRGDDERSRTRRDQRLGFERVLRDRSIFRKDDVALVTRVTNPVDICDVLRAIETVALVHRDNAPTGSSEPLRDDLRAHPPVQKETQVVSHGRSLRCEPIQVEDVHHADVVVLSDIGDRFASTHATEHVADRDATRL